MNKTRNRVIAPKGLEVTSTSTRAEARSFSLSGDVIAAGVIALTGLSFAVMALRIPAPADLTTAPGLLPFAVAASLAALAVAAAVSSLRGHGASIKAAEPEDRAETSGRLWAIAAVALYIAVLDFAPFSIRAEALGVQIPLGTFEAATSLLLVVLLRQFWGARLWRCTLVALGWTGLLALTFRGLFQTPLPG